MRDIKFRAFDKQQKHMITIFDSSTQENWFLPHCKENYEIMQNTGLKDKKGVDIYEGDIFKTRNGVIAVVEWDKENGRFLGFTLGRERKIVYIGREPAVEVIGNIHQNPELLEGQAYEIHSRQATR